MTFILGCLMTEQGATDALNDLEEEAAKRGWKDGKLVAVVVSALALAIAAVVAYFWAHYI